MKWDDKFETVQNDPLMKNVGKWQEITQIHKTKVEKEPTQQMTRIRGTTTTELSENMLTTGSRTLPLVSQREPRMHSQRETNKVTQSQSLTGQNETHQRSDGTPKQGNTSGQLDGTPEDRDTSQQVDGTPKHGNTSQQSKPKRSERTRGAAF